MMTSKPKKGKTRVRIKSRFYQALIVPLFLLMGSRLFGDTLQEIDHLLDFVGKTNCQFERNGASHTGTEAKAHMSKKYAYYKDKIHSAEDFIYYSATKSEITQIRYKTLCPGKTSQNSNEWLLGELKVYRKSQQTH